MPTENASKQSRLSAGIFRHGMPYIALIGKEKAPESRIQEDPEIPSGAVSSPSTTGGLLGISPNLVSSETEIP
ncbi:conserved hypothetical protein [Ricinus communis]|uniref:Uncharacterized protein n=1 Tax=Ricinus communis TaxID=3988 RepID=B9RPG9_RICCO|nr:conserved hypothetical protein [Ricinus communis]